MKSYGIVCLIGAGTAFGFYQSYRLYRRVMDIILLQNAFQLLETEIFYSLTPIPIAMRRLEETVAEPLQGCFRKIREAMEEEQQPVFQAWQRGVLFLKESTCCGTAELAAIQSFGTSFGEGDLHAQQKKFQLLQQRLKSALEEAEQIQKKQGTLWKYSGICISSAIAIVLC